MNKPHLYSRTNILNKIFTLKALEKFSTQLNWQPKASVVDVGSGPGNTLVNHILPQIPNFKQALGIDSSKEMVEYANKKYSSTSNLNFYQADIQGDEKLFKQFEAKFDYATSLFCLHLVQDQEKSFQNIHRMMKPGGKGLFIIVVGASLYDAMIILAKRSNWSNYREIIMNRISPYFGASNPIDAVKKNMKGFSKFDAFISSEVGLYKDENEFQDFVRSLPLAEGIPKERQSDYFNQMFEVLHDLGHIKNGRVEFPNTVLNVYAEK